MTNPPTAATNGGSKSESTYPRLPGEMPQNSYAAPICAGAQKSFKDADPDGRATYSPLKVLHGTYLKLRRTALDFGVDTSSNNDSARPAAEERRAEKSPRELQSTDDETTTRTNERPVERHATTQESVRDNYPQHATTVRQKGTTRGS